MNKVLERYQAMCAREGELKGRVNKKAETVYNSTKESLASLEAKRKVVEKDREQIMTVRAGARLQLHCSCQHASRLLLGPARQPWRSMMVGARSRSCSMDAVGAGLGQCFCGFCAGAGVGTAACGLAVGCACLQIHSKKCYAAGIAECQAAAVTCC